MNYTVSAKTARLLKDAGFPQDTHFWWISTSYRITKQGKRINFYTRIGDIREHHHCASLDDNLAAPIAEELLAHMPQWTKTDCLRSQALPVKPLTPWERLINGRRMRPAAPGE